MSKEGDIIASGDLVSEAGLKADALEIHSLI